MVSHALFEGLVVLGIEFDYILDKLPKPSSNVVQALMLSVRAADPEVQTQMERAAAGDRAVRAFRACVVNESWDLVTRVTIRVTILKTTYTPN